MSWKGTLLLLILAVAAAFLLLGRGGPTRPPGAPLLSLDPEKVERIVIRDAGGETVLAKLDGAWFVRSGTPDRADAGLVRSILSSALETAPLDTLRPSELKGPVSLEALDLKVPRRSITLTVGKKNETLSFGIEGAGQGRVYARLEGEAPVHLVSTGLADQIFRPAAPFRDTRLTGLRPDAPEKITFSTPGTGGKTFTLLRKGSDWTISDSTSGAVVRADRAAVGRFTESLLGTRVARWMPPETSPAACGLDTPSAVFQISSGPEVPPVTISVGKETGTAPGERYASCSDRKGLCVVKEGFSTALSADSLRDRHPAAVEPDAVDRIELVLNTTNAPTLLLQRKKGSDDWETPGREGTVPGSEVAAWIGRLCGVEATRFPAPGETVPLPSEKPMVIRLIARLSENTAEEGAGDIILSEISLYRLDHLEGTEAALMEKGSPFPMMLPAAPLRSLVTEAAAWTGTPLPPAIPLPSPATPAPSPTVKKAR
jgi:hypothetical protein